MRLYKVNITYKGVNYDFYVVASDEESAYTKLQGAIVTTFTKPEDVDINVFNEIGVSGNAGIINNCVIC